MATFTTRVELHQATYADYDTLHEAMQAEGFSRFIRSDDGTWYRLPTAEYNRSRDTTAALVLAAAKRAASKTGKKFSILVTEAGVRTWVGLEVVRSRATT
jgi:hypothetical protein